MKTKFLTFAAGAMLHANTPNTPPGTEYPGSAGEGNNTITDTIRTPH